MQIRIWEPALYAEEKAVTHIRSLSHLLSLVEADTQSAFYAKHIVLSTRTASALATPRVFQPQVPKMFGTVTNGVQMKSQGTVKCRNSKSRFEPKQQSLLLKRILHKMVFFFCPVDLVIQPFVLL